MLRGSFVVLHLGAAVTVQSEPIDSYDAIITSSSSRHHVITSSSIDSYDAIIAAAHARAQAVREQRLTAFDLTDFDRAANGHHPIPPDTSPRSQIWTGKGYQLVAAALSVQFHGKNKTAMAKATEFVTNMTINFQYNGYVPTSESGCVTKALSVYCNGTTACSTGLSALCNATRPASSQHHAHPACLQCVGANVGNPSLLECSDAEVSKFCSTGIDAPLSSQTEAQCTACANNLQRVEMTCHILHNPVMQLPIYNCDGCNPAAVEGYCSTVGSGHAPVTHNECFRTLSVNTKQCSFGMPLEQSHLVRAFSMFDSGSRWVKELGKTPWPMQTQELQRAFWFARAEVEQRLYPGAGHRIIWALYGSENIDASNQISVYLAVDALCQHPAYANRTMPDGKPLSENLKAWEQWAYDWLKARATGGLFVELGADYWGRTWPNILNLLDLPSSARVRQRAKMFIDIAQVEAEQAAVNGVRTGQKSRAKNDAITECMYNSLMPDLYGEGVTKSPHNSASWRGQMGEMTASAVTASNVSVLMHSLGKSPESNGEYLMQNRIIGEVNSTQVTTCSPARCKGTLRPTGCTCTKGAEAGKGSNGAYLMEPKSDQVHTIWMTSSYGMGAVVFSPNDYFSPNSQQRWVGLIFSDFNHTALGMPHLTGEKWGIVDEDIMLLQRCGSCNYGGDSIVHMYNVTLPQVVQRCGYAMVTVTDINGHEAYVAVRSAFGGDNITSACSGDSCKNNPTQLKPHDTWAPLILLTGRASEYGSFANFSKTICETKLDVLPAHQGGHVALKWKGHDYRLLMNNRTGKYQLPTKDGKEVEISPPFQYKGPHLNAALLSDTVTLSYKEYVLEYQFVDGADKIVRRGHSLKLDDYDAVVAAAHARAAVNRAVRVASWDATNFAPNPACGECTASFCRNWTLCALNAAPAIGTMFSNKNSSAIALANQWVLNMTMNMKQNGFTPAPMTNCTAALAALCGSARISGGTGGCEVCAGAHLQELNAASCQTGKVSAFCVTRPGPPPTRESCLEQCLQRNGSAASFSSCKWSFPLERSHFVRAFALFDNSSRFVKANGGSLPAWSPAAQKALRELFIAQTQASFWTYNESVYISSPLNMFGSENIDSSSQVTTYIALDVLSQIDSSMKFADGETVKTHLARWEAYIYAWIKHKATAGLFSELGSTGYWSRTWPNVFNLLDLPSSARVRQRAKMYIDIAMVEAEQCSIAGVRAGSKSRAKKGGFGHSLGITHSFYTSVTPQLYGTDLQHWPLNNTLLPPSNRIIENEAGWYSAGNVSILMHLLGKSPDTGGVYMMRNRMIGQVSQSDTTTCGDARCAETLRPNGCVCTKGADDGTNAHYAMLRKSDQLHSIWHTPSYALGGVEFSPNDLFSPNSQQRWTGLIFGNAEHTAVGLPHLTGEKWQLVDPDVMISQKCADCNYGGTSLLLLYNLTSVAALTQPCGKTWTVISTVDLQGQKAWAAMRSGWGGDTLVPPANLSSKPINYQLVPRDTWAPIIILTGREAQYNTLDNFSTAVCKTQPKHGHAPMHWGGSDLDFSWNGRSYCFHANIPDPATNETRSPYQAPSNTGDHGHGRNISTAPSYEGPHLNAALLSDTVTLSYKDYVLKYQFIDGADKIARKAA